MNKPRYRGHVWLGGTDGHCCKCGLKRFRARGDTTYVGDDGERRNVAGSCPGAGKRVRNDGDDSRRGFGPNTIRAYVPRRSATIRVRADLWQWVRARSVDLDITQSVLLELLISREHLAPVLTREDAYQYDVKLQSVGALKVMYGAPK